MLEDCVNKAPVTVRRIAQMQVTMLRSHAEYGIKG